jgi:DNA-binding SARP family transcriptional activator
MTFEVHLLGRPRVERAGQGPYQFRSRKSWAVLAYLILSERPPTRGQLASLLFAEADDPLRALRWSLTEIRRCLGADGTLDGDPLELRLPPGAVVDVTVLTHGAWTAAVDLPGLGADLLDGLTIHAAPAFESWLLSERRRVAAAAEAILHEAALGSLSRDDLAVARAYAVRATAMSPLDENHQALLIRLYRLAGDYDAAQKQYASCVDLFDRELGVAPGVAVEEALRAVRRERVTVTDEASIRAVVEAGAAAVAAGATDAGVATLRTAVGLADGAGAGRLRVDSRLMLAEALIHSLGGLDEEGMATLHDVDRIALATDDRASVARARAELGYVDFLRGRYDRAEVWLTDSLAFAHGSPSVTVKATTYLGSVASDRADYGHAVDLLEKATAAARAGGETRMEAYALSMLGRVSLLRGELDLAGEQLDASIARAELGNWLAFLPWPQALRGEALLAAGDPSGAAAALEQAFARACRLGDPCWEGMSARGLALVADATGDTERAIAILVDARARSKRLADAYVWLEAHTLDALCELGRRHGHPETRHWNETMRRIASRAGMRELTVRSLLHGAALGDEGDAAAAGTLAADIDNPALKSLLAR